VPKELEISATSDDGIVMAVRHRRADCLVEGVQFHPESVMTTLGGGIIENVLKLIAERRRP
jgi:anthranilate/para-aminobenzoate synthase component II